MLTDADVVKQASLKETSLSELARLCGVSNETEFVRRFIQFDREARTQ